jgi:hypothetical protein
MNHLAVGLCGIHVEIALMTRPILQPMVGFHQDEEGHWVAELACGHTQHVRHDPPWQNRPWVLQADTRATHVGDCLRCLRCERQESVNASVSLVAKQRQ